MAEINTIPYFPTFLWSRQLNLDLKDMKKYCLDYQKGATFSVKKSNKGGYQSPLYADNDVPESMKELKNYIDQTVNTITKSMSIPDCYMSSMWFNVNRRNHYNAKHTHSTSNFPCTISGVFYISIPKPGMGNITFYNDAPPYMKELHSKSMSIEPKENTLILFPSWLEHSVSQSKSDEPRISMSFNYLSKTVTPDDKIADLKSGIRRLS